MEVARTGELTTARNLDEGDLAYFIEKRILGMLVSGWDDLAFALFDPKNPHIELGLDDAIVYRFFTATVVPNYKSIEFRGSPVLGALYYDQLTENVYYLAKTMTSPVWVDLKTGMWRQAIDFEGFYVLNWKIVSGHETLYSVNLADDC